MSLVKGEKLMLWIDKSKTIRRRREVVVAVIFIFLLITYGIPQRHEWQLIHLGAASRPDPVFAKVIKKLELTPSFEYRRQCLKAHTMKGMKRQSVEDIPTSFLGQAYTLSTSSFAEHSAEPGHVPQCAGYTTIPVPPSPQKHILKPNELIFGMATTLQRLNDSLPIMSRWLSSSGATLSVLLWDQNSTDTDDVRQVLDLAQTLNVLITLFPREAMLMSPDDPLDWPLLANEEIGEVRPNFGLARVLAPQITLATKWIGIIDDDTFFTSLPKLTTALAAHDHTKPLYIGALTERRQGLKDEGFKAWGGAGFFLSPPLLSTIAAHYDDCVPLAGHFGDALWRDCIQAVTTPTVQLTLLPGLHQLDMLEDISAWYESGPEEVLSVHHWKSWHHHPVNEAHLVTDVAGTESFLARYRFGGDGVVLANGYSVVFYPNGVPELGLVERISVPWPEGKVEDGDDEYRFSMGRLRPGLREGTEKVSWRLIHAVADGRIVRQFYVKRGARGPNSGEQSDSVFEIDWSR